MASWLNFNYGVTPIVSVQPSFVSASRAFAYAIIAFCGLPLYRSSSRLPGRFLIAAWLRSIDFYRQLRETTYVTEPLDSFGYVDLCHEALNERCAKESRPKITPINVLIWQGARSPPWKAARCSPNIPAGSA